MGGAVDAAARPVLRPFRFFGGAAIKPIKDRLLASKLVPDDAPIQPSTSRVARSDGFS
jgi:hypothetical protein